MKTVATAVIIPTYNESDNIEALVKGILALRLGSGQAPWLGLAALGSLAALTVALVRKRKP